MPRDFDVTNSNLWLSPRRKWLSLVVFAAVLLLYGVALWAFWG